MSVALVAAMGVSLIGGQSTASAATVTTRADVASVTTGAAGTAFTLVLSIGATEQAAIGNTIILTTPTGFAFVGTPTIAVTTGPLTYGAGAMSAPSVLPATVTNNAVVTFTTTAANTVANTLTITGFVRNGGMGAGGAVPAAGTGGSAGVIALTGAGLTAGITDVGALNTAYVSPYTITLTTTPAVTGVAADGSQQISVAATVLDANGVAASNRAVVWTTSVGYLSTGTGKSATSFSSTAGVATQSYRGAGGVQTTDTIIASVSAGNAVATLSMPLTAPSGNTAAKLSIVAPSVQAIGPAANNVSPAYSSPTIGSHVALQVQDASGLGVNGQVILISVDKGAIVVNPAFATAAANTICNGVTANSITATSASTNLNAPGATANSSGWVNFTVCADQNDAVGQITVTAQNVSTSMANATTTLSHAGRPSKITATVNGSAISVKVTDSAGNAVADGTPVRFTMSANAGAVSVGCTTTTNGSASAVVALVAPTGTVIVSSDYNETGTVATASTCAAAGTQQIATSAVIGAGGGSTGGGTTGAGGFATAPVYSASKLAQAVFNGGTVAQLETAVTAGGGSGVWAQDSKGAFVLYIVGGGFVNDAFKAAFPNGFTGVTAVTVVGK